MNRNQHRVRRRESDESWRIEDDSDTSDAVVLWDRRCLAS